MSYYVDDKNPPIPTTPMHITRPTFGNVVITTYADGRTPTWGFDPPDCDAVQVGRGIINHLLGFYFEHDGHKESDHLFPEDDR